MIMLANWKTRSESFIRFYGIGAGCGECCEEIVDVVDGVVDFIDAVSLVGSQNLCQSIDIDFMG